jgi:hypothetical protein
VNGARDRGSGLRSSYALTVATEFERARRSVSVKAVHDDQLVGYLRSLGLNPAGILGHCKFCRDDVTVDNLAALFPESGDLKVVCHRRECLAGLQELIRDGVVKL